jgi:hypothetical protein
MKITIHNRLTNKVLFTATIKDTKDTGKNLGLAVLQALEKGANLSGANLSDATLSGANLSGANLSDATLSGADLSDAYLYGASLSRATLSGANLSGANLYGANLSRATLSRADLSGANLLCLGNMKEIKTIQIETYKIAYTKNTLQIGCKRFTIKDWKKFTNEEISKMHPGALKFWKKFKPVIMNLIKISPAE